MKHVCQKHMKAVLIKQTTVSKNKYPLTLEQLYEFIKSANKDEAAQSTILWARILVPDFNTNITSVCSWTLKAASQSSAKLDGSFSMVGRGSRL